MSYSPSATNVTMSEAITVTTPIGCSSSRLPRMEACTVSPTAKVSGLTLAMARVLAGRMARRRRPRRARARGCPDASSGGWPGIMALMLGSYLAMLPARLAEAISAGELETATRPPDELGIVRFSQADHLRVGPLLLPSALPRLTLDLDPPADARELCRAWGIERPVAVSPDVHQQTWWIVEAAAELPDPHGSRIAAERMTAGRWNIVPSLSERPAGDLPDVVSGASPAYEVLECGGAVCSIEVAPIARTTRVLVPRHPDAQALL